MILLPYLALATSLALVVYAYAAYPLLLKLLSAVRRRPLSQGTPDGGWPRISITVPVYNEEAQVRALIESLLRLDYPAERRQILIVSDASSDGTDDVVREYADHGVELLRMPVRGGKTAAENAASRILTGDIVVNTDATIRIHEGALKPLIARFADPTVGVASGRDVSVARAEEQANVGESGYVGYEMWVRKLETEVDGIVGASGCFYAIRSELHHIALPDALSRDFASALVAREHGYRAVSVDEAICYVPRTSSLHREYRRKVRTFARGMETLHFKRSLLNPIRYGIFSWMLFSHKVCRWLVPWALVVITGALATLALELPWARVAVLLGLAVALFGWLGWRRPDDARLPRLLALPAFAIAGNVAVLVAWAKALQGQHNPTWEPTRREVYTSVEISPETTSASS